jgi:adenylate kinase
MRLILLGPPGGGKGTQAKLLSQRLGLEHISTGDLLREAIRLKTPVGERARSFVESGRLVPDEVVNDLIRERFESGHPPERFVMDGYPRTLAQARVFDELLAKLGLLLTGVVHLEVGDEEIVRRIIHRLNCPKCGAIYHSECKPPRKPGICDVCGSTLVQRADDREDKVRTRLAEYHTSTEELLPYYSKQGLLREVAGKGDIEQIYQSLVKAF